MNQTRSDNLTILLHPQDDVAIARVQLLGGRGADGLPIKGLIPPGHKVARHAIAAGQPVRRYQQIIGFSSQAMAPGRACPHP